jgi:hypothetical protein
VHDHMYRYSGGAKRLRSGSESEAAASAGNPACKAGSTAARVPAPARQLDSRAAAQQGCDDDSGGSAQTGDRAIPAQEAPHEAGKTQDVQQQQQQQPGSATATAGQKQPRKKVPRIYFATRTHSQIAQVSCCCAVLLAAAGGLLFLVQTDVQPVLCMRPNHKAYKDA